MAEQIVPGTRRQGQCAQPLYRWTWKRFAQPLGQQGRRIVVGGDWHPQALERFEPALAQPGPLHADISVEDAQQHFLMVSHQHCEPIGSPLHAGQELQHSSRIRPAINNIAEYDDLQASRRAKAARVRFDLVKQRAQQIVAAVHVSNRVDAFPRCRSGRTRQGSRRAEHWNPSIAPEQRPPS